MRGSDPYRAFRILKPTVREGLSTKALKLWIEDDTVMADAEDTALFELLDAGVQAAASRRTVNDAKAEGLDWAYRWLALEILAAAPVLVTLVR